MYHLANHRIGNNSSYDGDMDIIESFVKFTKDKHNVLLSAELCSYYISRALFYWQQLEEYIESGQWRNLNNKRIKGGQTILNNLQLYKNEFLDMINSLENTFDNEKIINIFIYIGNLSCLFEIDEPTDQYELIKNLKNFKKDHIFPLVNGNGNFSLNTWLYSFFEGIHLVGFTSGTANFDGYQGCSLELFNHDLGHTYYGTTLHDPDVREDFYVVKNIYYNIINSSFLSKEEKELYILVLWVAIHEVEYGLKFSISVQESIIKFIEWTVLSSAHLIVMKEFLKFSHILLHKSNVDNALYYIESLRSSLIGNKPFVSSILAFARNINSNNRRISNYQYLFLGLVYVFKDIYENYAYYSASIA